MASARMSLKRRALTTFIPGSQFLERRNWLGYWRKMVEAAKCPMYKKREDIYWHVQNYTAKYGAIDLLEFGVADGESLRHWCGLNSDPQSRFFGFDCFTGLPEKWRAQKPKGSFNRNGQPPEIADSRVSFEVGMFQDTLPAFLNTFEPRENVIVHNDCDLYSSTLYVLTMMQKVRANPVFIFDEFWDAMHEFRAIYDFCSAYRKSPFILAATRRFDQAAIRFV